MHKHENKLRQKQFTQSVTTAGRSFTGIGEAKLAIVDITFTWTGACTTHAVWGTSYKANVNKKTVNVT